jgi:hypothetical protein
MALPEDPTLTSTVHEKLVVFTAMLGLLLVISEGLALPIYLVLYASYRRCLARGLDSLPKERKYELELGLETRKAGMRGFKAFAKANFIFETDFVNEVLGEMRDVSLKMELRRKFKSKQLIIQLMALALVSMALVTILMIPVVIFHW